MFLKITHGYSIERASPDPLISLIERAAEEFYIAAAPGAWIVDIFPWRAYAGVLRFAELHAKALLTLSSALATMATRYAFQGYRVTFARDVRQPDGGTNTICEGADGVCHSSNQLSIECNWIRYDRRERKEDHASPLVF